MEKRYLDELKIAEEFFEIAKKNLNESLRTSANRLYFALEKSVVAYLLFKQVKVPKSHRIIWELSSKEIGQKYYDMLRKLYDLRMQADYGNVSIFADFNIKILGEKILQVEKLINEIKMKIKREE